MNASNREYDLISGNILSKFDKSSNQPVVSFRLRSFQSEKRALTTAAYAPAERKTEPKYFEDEEYGHKDSEHDSSPHEYGDVQSTGVWGRAVAVVDGHHLIANSKLPRAYTET